VSRKAVQGADEVHISKSALVGFTPGEMYALVADVAAYPRLFNWCEAARILDEEHSEVCAELSVRVLGVSVSFATRNRQQPPERIDLRLESGPFRTLTGHWTFKPVGDLGCRVTLDLRFQMNQGLVASAAALAFAHVADRMVDDFARAAKNVYR
jgi:ribosome-associated toxin RatA of RatAB toxin-antitoxin module